MTHGNEADAELRQLSQQLHDMEVALNGRFPLADQEMNALFADLQTHLEQIYLTEKEALTVLAGALK